METGGAIPTGGGTERNRLSLLHLSDIHFVVPAGGDPWDEDALLRAELENDLRRAILEFGAIDGILVTGDVASTGQADQYIRAAQWLETVSAIVGCRESDIWTVPGNHDVLWTEIAGSRTIQDFHARLRSCDRSEIDTELINYLVADKAGGEAQFAPLRNYIAFATLYDCHITPSKPFWEDSVPIGATGFTLRLRGMTTPIISDEHDNQDASKLVLGSVQARMERKPLTMTVTLAHHPPSWLRDGEAIEDALRTKAHALLWGHGHIQSLVETRDYVHLYAGAVQPYRREPIWEPRYNIIELEPRPATAECKVTIRQRVWRRQEARFGPDLGFDGTGSTILTYRVESLADLGLEAAAVTPDLTEPEPARGARRGLAYAFSSLPYQRRLSVARSLDLLDPTTRDVSDQDLFELVFTRAIRVDRLAELWDMVQTERQRPTEPNPFRQA